jgi:hypothetical protein
MAADDQHWKARCTPAQYRWLRTEKGFAVCITLARSLNQLRYARHAIDGISQEDRPSFVTRREFNTIFIAAATLYEAIEFARTNLGRHFRNYPEFDAVAASWKQQDNKELLQNHIAPLRNQAVSHFDPTETQRQLADLTITEECVFAVGHGNVSRDVYYRMADGLAVMTFVRAQEDDTEDTLRDKTILLARRMAALSHAFIYASENLLGAVLRDYGFDVVPISEDDGDNER